MLNYRFPMPNWFSLGYPLTDDSMRIFGAISVVDSAWFYTNQNLHSVYCTILNQQVPCIIMHDVPKSCLIQFIRHYEPLWCKIINLGFSWCQLFSSNSSAAISKIWSLIGSWKASQVVNDTGFPWVENSYPYPYPLKFLPLAQGRSHPSWGVGIPQPWGGTENPRKYKMDIVLHKSHTTIY